MRAIHRFLAILAILAAAPTARAITLPLDLELAAPTASVNRMTLIVDLQPTGLSNQSKTNTSDATGNCAATFKLLFDPVSYQATASQLTLNLERPGRVSLSDTHFAFSWLLGLVKENIDATNLKVSPYTTVPPSSVSGGQFAANEQSAEFNGGSLVYSGVASGNYDLSTDPLDGQNTSTSPGTIAISAPTMNGNLATYGITIQMPLAVDQTIVDPQFTARIRATGTLKATGTFQFDFGPRNVYWEVASGDFATGENWDTGFVPRTGDTAAIQNGGTVNLATAVAGVPAAVWVGNAGVAGTLSLSGAGSLDCDAVVLGRETAAGILNLSGGTLSTRSIARGSGSGTLNFAGGTLRAKAHNAHFLEGLTAARVQSGGATIHTNGFDVTVAQPLLADPASPGGGLVKQGAGTLLLTAANTYTGNTTVAAGKLDISGSIGSSAGVSVAEGAELILSRSAGNVLASTTVVANDGTLRVKQLTGLNTEVVGRITGVGTMNLETNTLLAAGDVVQGILIVGVAARLSATSIQSDTLTIGAGAAVTIRPATAAASAASGAQPVPEPGTVILLLAGGLVLLTRVVSRHNRHAPRAMEARRASKGVTRPIPR